MIRNNNIYITPPPYTKLQHRLDAMYIDKLDGRISQESYDQKSMEWRAEQDKVLGKIEKHQSANRSYLDEGAKLLELSQKAVKLYEQRPMSEKRRILNFVCSNSIWKDGQLHPVYRQPFEILAVTNREYQQKKAAFVSESDLRSVWLPVPDSNFFREQSQEIIDTIATIQDFMAA